MRDLTAVMADVLAANIKGLRIALGDNQAEFGDRLGVSQGTVARWEGGSEPKHDPLVRMADLAGRTVKEFTTQIISDLKPRAAGAEPRNGFFVGEGAPLLLPVHLPSEEALAEMFSALLEVLEGEADRDVRAHRLAQLLPSALAQCVFRSTDWQLAQDAMSAPERGVRDPATASREQQPAPRT